MGVGVCLLPAMLSKQCHPIQIQGGAAKERLSEGSAQRGTGDMGGAGGWTPRSWVGVLGGCTRCPDGGQWGEIQGRGTFRASVRKVPKDALLCFDNLDSLPSRGRF